MGVVPEVTWHCLVVKIQSSVLLAGKRQNSSLTMSLLDLRPVLFGGNEKISLHPPK